MTDAMGTAAERKARMKRGELRYGYTTGACATAAAQAATLALLAQEAQTTATITLPAGQRVVFALHSCEVGPDAATCSVIKDGGDDPDATHGAEIRATVKWGQAPGLVLERGEGVGVVTKPGLGLEVGGPAINPVPRRMITEHVLEVARSIVAERGLRVVVSCPTGEEVAKKTLNPRLGILGGISILGTSGIVVPYSTAAFRASIVQAIGVARHQGVHHVVLTTGGRSEKFAMRLLPGLPEEAFVEMGEFVGFSAREAAKAGMGRVTLCGMIGKLSKVAAGAFQVHVNSSQVDMEFLAGIAACLGGSQDLVAEVHEANTARHVGELVAAAGLAGFFDEICRQVCVQVRDHVLEKEGVRLEVACIMTDFEGNVQGRAGTHG